MILAQAGGLDCFSIPIMPAHLQGFEGIQPTEAEVDFGGMLGSKGISGNNLARPGTSAGFGSDDGTAGVPTRVRGETGFGRGCLA